MNVCDLTPWIVQVVDQPTKIMLRRNNNGIQQKKPRQAHPR